MGHRSGCLQGGRGWGNDAVSHYQLVVRRWTPRKHLVYLACYALELQLQQCHGKLEFHYLLGLPDGSGRLKFPAHRGCREPWGHRVRLGPEFSQSVQPGNSIRVCTPSGWTCCTENLQSTRPRSRPAGGRVPIRREKIGEIQCRTTPHWCLLLPPRCRIIPFHQENALGKVA